MYSLRAIEDPPERLIEFKRVTVFSDLLAIDHWLPISSDATDSQLGTRFVWGEEASLLFSLNWQINAKCKNVQASLKLPLVLIVVACPTLLLLDLTLQVQARKFKRPFIVLIVVFLFLSRNKLICLKDVSCFLRNGCWGRQEENDTTRWLMDV